MNFWKVEAIGNDFVLVHGDDTVGVDLPELARRVSDRHFGVGSDGLLVLAGRNLRMFNPDGSEDFCGNGLRCAAVHAFHQGWIDATDSMVHHGLPVRVWMTGEESARVELLPASFLPERVPTILGHEIFRTDIPVAQGVVNGSSLTTGTTHTVLFHDAPLSDDEFLRIGTALEHHEWFPERTSTMFVVPEEDRCLRMRPFERGAGETRGCGTGSAAAAVVWSRMTGFTGAIEVRNTGGTVLVTLEDWHGPILLESETKTVFEGVLQPELVPLQQKAQLLRRVISARATT